MNNSLYRVIFNRARGMPMVVPDIAGAGQGCAQRGPLGKAPPAARLCRLMALRLGLLMTFGAIAFNARAGFEADPNAPGHHQPDIMHTAKGIPQIDIQAPDEHGVSHNTYRQFDVDPAGVILNNSGQPTRAELSGYVDANPWLAGGEARVIINEVNSPHASHLNGWVEVAGRSAEVIIANPAGITCDGCGFINAHNATLAAGQVIMEDGRLKGFDVERGEIVFQGGKSNLNTDHATLIARAVRVNAEMQARDLTITTGRNVTDSRGNVIRKKDDDAPVGYALDVAALGGMYARKIHLLGNEHGIGVRNAGDIGASIGEITLTVEGRLENSGNISSTADLRLTAGEIIQHPQGKTASHGDAHLRVNGPLHNNGRVAARGDMTIEAASLHSGQGSSWEAGRDERGNIAKAATLNITTPGAVTLGGTAMASRTLAVSGATLDLSGGLTASDHITLRASRGEIRLSGGNLSADRLDISTPGGIDNDGGTLNAGRITLTATGLSNRNGHIQQTGGQDLALVFPSPSDGDGASPSVTDPARNRHYQASVSQGGIHHSTASSDTGAVDNAGGRIQAAGNITVKTGRLLNSGGTLQAAGHTSVNAGTIDNRAGRVQGDGNASMSAAELDNRGGRIQAFGHAAVDAGIVNNADDGRIVSKNDADINAETLNNTFGWIDATGNLRVNAKTLENRAGKLQSRGTAKINNASLLDNTQGKIQAASISLNSGTLINHTGEISSSGNIAIHNAALLDNTQGKVKAAGVSLNSGTLVNHTGEISSSGNIAIHNADQLVNTQGKVHAFGNLTVITGALDNGIGRLFSAGAAALYRGNAALRGAFSNTGGQIQGNRSLEIIIGDSFLDNNAGMLSSLNTFELKTAALTNRAGSISATGNGILQIDEQLDNSAGFIQSGDVLAIRADRIINTDTRREKGGIESPHLHITARRLDNAGGAVRATERLEAALTETLDNRQGLLSSEKVLIIRDDAQGHRLEADNDGGKWIAGEQGTFTLRRLTGNGQIRSMKDLVIRLRDDFQLMGELEAGGDLTLHTEGCVTNERSLAAGGALLMEARHLHNGPSAQLQANELQLTLPGALSNHGQMRVDKARINAGAFNNAPAAQFQANDWQLSLPGALSNHGQMRGDKARINAGAFNNAPDAQLQVNDLQLTLTGELSNHGLLRMDKARLVADALDNAADGEILGGDVTLSLRGPLVNTGLIDIDHSRLDAETLSNSGSGRIYGDRIALRARRLENYARDGRSAVVAARERLDIGADHLDNRDNCLISSDGDMAIGGELDTHGQAIGRAGRLENHNAEISANGDLSITAREITNTNGGLTLARSTRSEARHEGVLKGQTTRYDWRQIQRKCNNKYGVHDAITPDGNSAATFYEYRYIRSITEDRIEQSHPARILAGGTMTLDADSLLNQDSRINAGGPINSHIGNLRNEATQGERTTLDRGRQTHWYEKKKKKKLGKTKTSQGHDRRAYRPGPVKESIPLKALAWQENTRADAVSLGFEPQRAGLFRRGRTDKSSFGERWRPAAVKPPVMADHPEQLFSRPLDLFAGHVYEHPLAPEIGEGGAWTPTVRVMTPAIQLPASSLFTLHPGPAHRYLVETDPRYTQFKQWIGLDYMQDKIKFNPSLTHKRLGDGFYEQRLVRDQILHLTGQRYLNGHTNDGEQFKTLMNAGVQFGNAFNLTPGIMLSPSQMALLTTDMVWLVSRDVTLADGSSQQVLVPQVYARIGKGSLSGEGALISGRDIRLDAGGDVENSGNIIARDTAAVNANNLDLTGRIAAKNIEIHAKKDIRQTGGGLFGGDRLSLLAEQDIRVQSTLRGDGDNRWLDRPAGIYVQNERGALELKALNNITLAAAAIANKGEHSRTTIAAGGDLIFDTLTTAKEESAYWDQDNYRVSRQQTDIGSRIDSDGAIALSAGRDFSARAAYIDAVQQLDLHAGRDISLTSGLNISSVIEHGKQSSSGMLSTMSLETHDEVHRRQALGSLLSGETVRLTAGRDLSVSGGNIAGTGDIALTAGNNLTLTTAEETRHESHFREEKSSGLMGSGGIGFTVGKAGLAQTDGLVVHQHKGSLAGSELGSARLQAGGKLNVHGSDVLAGQNIALSGADVELTAAENSIVEQNTMEQKRSGFTLALSGAVGSAINSAVQNVRQAENTDNSRLAALHRTKAALSGMQAVGAGALASAQGDSAQNDNTIGISLSYGSQSASSEQRHEQHAAQGSTLASGGNISITATGRDGAGDITLQGAQLQTAQDISLNASRDIHLLSVLNREKTEGSNSSQGGMVGVGIGVGQGGFGISVFAGINKGKGSERGNGIFHTNTLLDAGRQIRLTGGRDAVLAGAQVNGETVNAEIGRHLLMQSRQDSDNYDSKQLNISAGGQFTFGSMTGSGSINISRDTLHSRYNAVREQTGIFAGKGGADIRVGEHTQLDGAVIGSTATADKNHLETGTLGFSDIHNQAEFKAEHQSIGLSSGGPVGSQFSGNLANTLLAGSNRSDSDNSGTKAAFSPGSLLIRNQRDQRQDIAALSRDAERAHETLSPLFDKEKEQRRLQQVTLLADIGNQVMDIVRTGAAVSATRAAATTRDHPGETDVPAARIALAHGKNLNQSPTEAQIRQHIFDNAYNQALADSGFGIGGSGLKVLTAATAAVQGLANGNLGQAIAGAASPYVAGEIKAYSGDNDTLRLTGHALAGALLSHLQGNSALAGGAGALGAEVAAKGITDYVYGVSPNELTEKQKDKVGAISTAVGGLAGGLTGSGLGDAVAGAQTGKNAVENNFLTGDDGRAFEKEWADCKTSGGDCDAVRDKYAAINARRNEALEQVCADSPLTCASYQKQLVEHGLDAATRPTWMPDWFGAPIRDEEIRGVVQTENAQALEYINKNTDNWDRLGSFVAEPENVLGLAGTAKSAFAKSATITAKATGAAMSLGANAGMQIYDGKTGDKFEYASLLTAGVSGAAGVGKSLNSNVRLNVGGAYMSSQVNGEDSKPAMMGAAAGTALGFGAGTAITKAWEAKLVKEHFGMAASKNALKYSDTVFGPGYLFKEANISPVPGAVGGFTGAIGTESVNSGFIKLNEKDNK